MKKIFAFIVGASLSMGVVAQSALHFDSSAGVKSSMTVYDGTTVNFTAYERLFYVTNVEDSTYQYLNVYVPDGATQQTPIFLRTYVGGYMASPAAQPQAGDATGRALKEGYVVVIPGTRGRNSSVVADKAYAKAHKGIKKGQTIYTGRAPKAILDLKAEIAGNLVGYIPKIQEVAVGVTQRVSGYVRQAVDWVKNHSDQIKSAVLGIRDGVATAWGYIKPVLGFAVQHARTLIPAILGVVGAISAVSVSCS